MAEWTLRWFQVSDGKGEAKEFGVVCIMNVDRDVAIRYVSTRRVFDEWLDARRATSARGTARFMTSHQLCKVVAIR
jgi:hypothetical protein